MRRAITTQLEHWAVFCGVRTARDGWTPSRTYRIVAGALIAWATLVIAIGAARDRGPVVAAGITVLMGFGTFLIFAGHRHPPAAPHAAPHAPFVDRHPYLDAAFSIPIGVLGTLLLFPSWPVATCLAVAAGYVVLIYALAWRRVRRTAKARPQPTT